MIFLCVTSIMREYHLLVLNEAQDVYRYVLCFADWYRAFGFIIV